MRSDRRSEQGPGDRRGYTAGGPDQRGSDRGLSRKRTYSHHPPPMKSSRKSSCMYRHLLSAIASVGLTLLGAHAHSTEMLLGLAIAESGPIASFDIPTLHGMQIAIEELNRGGGIGGRVKIKTIIKDTRSDAAQTAIATQELVDDGVNVLVIPG